MRRLTTTLLTLAVLLTVMLGRSTAAQTTTTTITAVNVVTTSGTNAALSFSYSSSVAPSDLRYQVSYGPTVTYGTDWPIVATGLDTTTPGNQAVTLLGLTANTTYHFTVKLYNPTNALLVSSADRTFTTASTDGDSSLLSIERVRVDCVNTSCNIYFATTKKATVEARWDTGSQPDYTNLAFTSYNTGTSEASPSDTFRSLHIPTPSQAPLEPNTQYHYRLHAVGTSGATTTTGDFTLHTSANASDHVFATGNCSQTVTIVGPPQSTRTDTVDIGSCLGSSYCAATGLVSDCTKCGYTCEVGKTCRTGAPNPFCVPDRTLTGAPSQCNTSSCYDPRGVFISPAPAACVGSWPRCNANTILKVRNDRGCNLWLSCATSIQTEGSASGPGENLCLSLTACNSLNVNGQCNHYLPLGQCNNDPLRFCNNDSDCQGGGTCNSPDPKEPTKALQTLTYQTPKEAAKIADLSGNVIAGLDWTQQGGANVIQGNLPWQLMRQIGGDAQIKNGDFEFRAPEITPWNPVPEGLTPFDSLRIEFEDKDNGPNHVLTIEPLTQTTSALHCSNDVTKSCAVATQAIDCATPTTAGKCVSSEIPVPYSGAATNSFTASPSEYYYAEARIRGDGGNPVVRVQFGHNNYTKFSVTNETVTTDTFVDVPTTAAWQRVTLGPLKGMSGLTKLAFVCADAASCNKFQIDDVVVKPILQVNTNPNYIVPSCRLYPKSDSPSCDYADTNGVLYKGWKGYCLEHDSQTGTCLSRWPVDIIKGESSIFGSEKAAGYQDRAPLFLCAESAGFYNATASYVTIAGVPSIPAGLAFTTKNIGFKKPMFTCSSNGADNYALSTNPTTQCKTSNDWVGSIFMSGDNYMPADDKYSGGAKIAVLPPDEKIKEQDIQQIELNVTAIGFGGFGGTFNITSQTTISATDTSHANCDGLFGGLPWTFCESNNVEGENFAVIHFQFDATGTLKKIWYKGFDGSNGSGSVTFTPYFFLKEQCDKLVQVVDQNGTASAFASRVGSSVYKVPNLNYGLSTDLGPFGGALPRQTSPNDPTAWPLLSAEQPNFTSNQPPGQARSGSPYACNGKCEDVICTVDNTTCLNSDGTVNQALVSKCQQGDADKDGTPDGQCVGVVSKIASQKGPQQFGSNLRCISVPSGGKFCGGTLTCNAPTTGQACSSTIAVSSGGGTPATALQFAASKCGFSPLTSNTATGRATATTGTTVACNGTVGSCAGTADFYNAFQAGLVRQLPDFSSEYFTCTSGGLLVNSTSCTSISDGCICQVSGSCSSTQPYTQGNVNPASKSCINDAECLALAVDPFFAQERIKRLFAQSFGIWSDLRCSTTGLACLVNSDCGGGSCSVRSGKYLHIDNSNPTILGAFVGWKPPATICQENPAFKANVCTSSSQQCTAALQVNGVAGGNENDLAVKQRAMEDALKNCGLVKTTGSGDLPTSAGSVITGTQINNGPGVAAGKTACNGVSTECPGGGTTGYEQGSTASFTTFTLSSPCSFNATNGTGYTCTGRCTSTASYINAGKPTVVPQSKYLRPAYVAGSQADYCAIPPEVTNAKFTTGTATTATISGGSGSIGIKFNTTADLEQVPLANIRIDWGDNQDDFAFPFAPRNDPTKPHIFSHTYVVNRGDTTRCTTVNGRTTCTFPIKIQVEDSWKWCNDDPAAPICNADSTKWFDTGLKVTVQP